MNLSKRLKAIADLIDNNSFVIDVGCDHAFLDIFLTVNKDCNCLAIDNKETVLKYSKANINKYKLNNKIKLLLNDGLNNITINKDDIVVLSGLGTKNILNIIKDKNINNLIIQSNDNIYNLRYELVKRGFKIIDEKIIYERKKYYIIIKFVKEKIKYNKLELKYGPILLKNTDEVFKNYLNEREKYLENLLSEIPKNHILRKIKLSKELKQIKRY